MKYVRNFLKDMYVKWLALEQKNKNYEAIVMLVLAITVISGLFLFQSIFLVVVGVVLSLFRYWLGEKLVKEDDLT